LHPVRRVEDQQDSQGACRRCAARCSSFCRPSDIRRRRGQDSLKKELRISDPRINDRIRVPEVRLVGPGGEQVGVVRLEDALRLAREADLDLVEVAPNSRPPVVKIMDYGKFKYEEQRKAREARKKQHQVQIKEVKMRPGIEDHDFDFKVRHARRFLEEGNKVKLTMMFRGRQMAHPEYGRQVLDRVFQQLQDLSKVESHPMLEGRSMVMVLAPTAKPPQAASASAAAPAQQAAPAAPPAPRPAQQTS